MYVDLCHMKKYRYAWKVLYTFIFALYSVIAVSASPSMGWAQIALVYYKDFSAGAVKNNVPVPGCLLRMASDESGSMLWHCRERAYLIRPLSTVAALQQKTYNLNYLTEFNFNHIRAQIMSVHPVNKPSAFPGNSYVPVTGVFITHSFKVKEYQFKNMGTGHTSKIRATVSHPFYTENSGSFVPVFNLTSTDHLINNKQETIQLLCQGSHITHCGTMVSGSLPTRVYNLETYKQHTFYAGDEKIFVHNCDESSDTVSSGDYDLFYTVPINNHVFYEEERTDNTISKKMKALYESEKGRISVGTSSCLQSKAFGGVNVPRERVAFYCFRGAESSEFPDGVLFKDEKISMDRVSGLVALSAEETVEIMRQAPEFEKADTLFVINSAPSFLAAGYNRGFKEYFEEISAHSKKNVTYNSVNVIRTFRHQVGGVPMTGIGGVAEGKVRNDFFTFNRFVRIVYRAKVFSRS